MDSSDNDIVQSVYAIHTGPQSPVKLGIAIDVQQRIKDLQCANPSELSLVFSIPGSRKTECSLHAVFDCCRVRGEWFHHDSGSFDIAIRRIHQEYEFVQFADAYNSLSRKARDQFWIDGCCSLPGEFLDLISQLSIDDLLLREERARASAGRTMPRPRKTPQLIDRYATSPELRAAIAKYCKRHKIDNKSEFIRQAIAEKLGKPELLNTVQMGRPPKLN